MTISPIDIILKKRNGGVLSKEEINFFVQSYTRGDIPDYQTAALMMTIYFQGMNMDETVALTKAMIASGETIDLTGIGGIIVDKHSTGGVGDKTSLILGPMVAAAGVKVAKLSGRGLGHSGGTIDKLESIRGFSVEMTRGKFIRQVQDIGLALMGQTKELVPADKKIYALRDVTGTVECLPLIASSIMSKKLASGADAIVLDVKTGAGSFNGDVERTVLLAQLLVNLGESMGKSTVALITEMDQPLGNAVGNALEVKEAIETLNGNGPQDLEDLCVELGGYMLCASQRDLKLEKARKIVEETLYNGTAKRKFETFIQAQGGDLTQIRNSELLPQARRKLAIKSNENGYITRIQADMVGKAAMLLGAGRKQKHESIDHATGVYLNHKVGAYVEKGETMAYLYVNGDENLIQAENMLRNAFSLGEKPSEIRPLVWARVSKDGVERYY